MVNILYILLVCYMPILDSILPRTNFGPGIPDVGPVQLLSYFIILVFILESAVKKQIKIFSKFTGFIIVYSIIVLVSVSWSNYSYTSDVLQNLFNSVLIPLIIAIIGLNLFTERDNIDAYIKNIMIALFILSLMSIYQLLSSDLIGSTATFGDEVRSTATFGNPNGLAIFLVLTIPCLIYAVENHMVTRILGWVLYASVAGGIICTISRKGMATGILVFCLYYFLKGKYKRMFALGIVVVILTLFLSGYAVISGRFSRENMDKQFIGKWNMTYAGLQMYKESPLIGLGYKGYYDNFGKYFPWSSRDKYDAHNIFITALTNYGLIGFIPFLCIFLYPLSVSWKVLKVDNSRIFDSTSKDLAIICVSSIIPFMLSGWFAGGLFYRPTIMFLLYTNIALLLAGCHLSSDGEKA